MRTSNQYKQPFKIRVRYFILKRLVACAKYFHRHLKQFRFKHRLFLKNYERQQKIGMSTHRWQVTKQHVKRRDNFRCCKCHRKQKSKDLTVDHIKPLKDGGDSAFKNLQTLCRPCHTEKTRLENWRTTSGVTVGFPIVRDALEEAKILTKKDEA